MAKVPIIKNNNFIIYLEDDAGVFFIHCDILSKWNKSIKKELQDSFLNLTKLWNKELFALHTPADKKHEKFLKMFGFNYLKTITGLDNNDYDVYIWR